MIQFLKVIIRVFHDKLVLVMQHNLRLFLDESHTRNEPSNVCSIYHLLKRIGRPSCVCATTQLSVDSLDVTLVTNHSDVPDS